ncbi:MAG: AAA family ATPase [bacterium]|nr:AAA family ATPase [bacterium]MBU1916773.1 AAA family ATPase [bacterium]
MYLNYFHLREEPFNNTPDPRFLYLSRQHEEALESLLYGIRERKGFMAVIGEIGTGKTTLCRTLITRLDSQVDTSVIFNPMLSVSELLMAINDDFGNRRTSQTSVKAQIDSLNRFLLGRLKQNKNAVVIVDEAQHLTTEALEMLRMLSNLETANKKLLQIIFLGQIELNDKLGSPELKQLNQRIAIRYLLGPLTYPETCDYIVHRLSLVTKDLPIQFEERAMKHIYKYSRGIPRLINTLCDRALLDAYACRKPFVTKKMISRVKADVDGVLNTSGAHMIKPPRVSFLRRLFS